MQYVSTPEKMNIPRAPSQNMDSRMHLKNGRSTGNGAYVPKGLTSRVMVAGTPKVGF
jgi:hypothetical protein